MNERKGHNIWSRKEAKVILRKKAIENRQEWPMKGEFVMYREEKRN